jgi:hypothetical protein
VFKRALLASIVQALLAAPGLLLAETSTP